MKIKNKILKTLIMMGIVASLSACNSGTEQPAATPAPSETKAENTDTKPEEPAEPTEVTDIVWWTKDRHDQEFMAEFIEQFNKDNPDINLIQEIYTDNYQQTIEIASTTGELPDIVGLVMGNIVNNLLTRDLLLGLNDYITPEFKSTFGDDLFIEGVNMKDGEIFTFPFTGNSTRLIYNKDIFERVGLSGPPKSVEELVEYSKKITDELSSEGIYGFALPLKGPRSGLVRGFVSIPSMSGMPVAEGFDYSKGEYDFTGYKTALEGFREIWASGAAFPGCESLEIDPLRTQFADGKIGMYMSYSHSEYGVYTNQFPTDVEWGYALLPTNEGEIKGSQKMNAGAWFAIAKTTENPDKAWRVLEAIYSKDLLVPYYEQSLGVTILDSVTSVAKQPDGIAYTAEMAVQPSDKIWPSGPLAVTPEGPDWGEIFVNAMFDSSINIDAAIEDVNTRYNEAYQKSMDAGTDVLIKYPNFDPTDPANTMN